MTRKDDTQNRLEERLRHIPTGPGCYLWLGKAAPSDKDNRVLYVGKALSLRSRTRQYLSSDDYKTRFLMAKVLDIDWISTNNEVEALLLENNLIKKHSPPYNVQLRDDKSYPYLCLTMGEPFPRLIVTRKKKNPNHLYFGPYIDAGAARNTLALIHKIFPIRKRALKLPLKRPGKPCLNYHIGRCLSPCSGKVGIEEYGELIEKIKAFLEGKNTDLAEKLQKEMEGYSQRMEFEKAAQRRDMLKDIETLYSEQSVHAEDESQNYDVIGQYVVSRLELAESLDIEPPSGDLAASFLAQFVLLRVRNGNLINKGAYTMTEIPAEVDDAHLREEFMEGFFREYYLHLPDPPPKIFVAAPFQNSPVWSKAILQNCGVSCEIVAPPLAPHIEKQGGAQTAEGEEQNRGLMRMAVNNARLTLREKILSERIRNQRFGLRQIQKFLDLAALPETIECYDISNIQGKQAVGCGVSLKNGLPHKAGYRRYKIKTKDTPDDPAMMGEVIARRLARLKGEAKGEKRWGAPDLIVIDGGATQLGAALQARSQAGIKIPMIGLAKKLEEVYTEEGEILQMDKNSPGMLILRLARDEAHRFSLAYHRLLRGKKAVTSTFEDIPGIGPQKAKKIVGLIQSSSLEKLSPEEQAQKIAAFAGISLEAAQEAAQKAAQIAEQMIEQTLEEAPNNGAPSSEPNQEA